MQIAERKLQDRAAGQLVVARDEFDLTADIMRVLRVIRERKSIVLGTMFLVTALVALVTFQLTPKYTAYTQVLIDPQQNPLVDFQAAFAGLSPETSTVESQVHVMQSRSLIQRVVNELDLMNDPEFNPSIEEKGASIIPSLNPVSWLPPSWRAVVSGGEESKPFLTQEQETAVVEDEVIHAVQDGLGVLRVGSSFAIDVSFTSVSSTKAARIANKIGQLYTENSLETKFEATRRTTNWLNERLRLVREELRASEEAIEAFKAEHNLLGTSQGATLNNQNLQELQRNLVLAKSARAEAEVRLQQIREIYESGGGITRVANVISSTLIAELRNQDAALLQKEANLATRYQSRHPEMIKIRSERANLKKKMEDEVRRFIQELENNVEVARARERAIQESLSEQQVKNAEQNRFEIQLRELELEAEGNRQIYETFLSRFKATSNQDTIQQSDARIISEATVPQSASFPNRRLFVGGGFLFSAFLGMALALLAERLDNGFRTVEQLENTTGIRNLAVVPLLKGLGKTKHPHEYVIEKPLSSYSEAIRSIQNSLFLASGDRQLRYILTTSALPGEGKSTTSLSLARLLAKSGKSTILLDADMRRPSIAKSIGQSPHDRGLVDVLNGSFTLNQAVVHDHGSGLDILTTKEGGADTPDLLNSQNMKSLLEELGRSYEMVVIDAPPVLPVGDTKLLSRLVDAVVFVVRWENTPRDASTKAMQSLIDVGANLVGTAMTQVDFDRYSRYGHGDPGRYYGRYAGYYVD